MDFKQRQVEVEKSQVTMSIKLGQGSYGEVCIVATIGQSYYNDKSLLSNLPKQMLSVIIEPGFLASGYYNSTVLYCAVLYCEHCTVLYCTVLYCEHCSVLYCTLLCALDCTVLYCTVSTVL